jgi:hypothetical protein
MATSLYVMPLSGTGAHNDQREPKYYAADFPTLAWSMADYGNEPWCLVGIPNVPPATDTILVGHPDVFGLPANLDQTMGTVGQRNTVRNRLEAVNMPGTWIQTTDTYRTVVRFIMAVCQVAQRVQGLGGTVWFTGGITLDSLYSALPTGTQTATLAAANSAWVKADRSIVHFDSSAVIGTNPMRTVLQSLGNQYVALGLSLNLGGPL